MQPCPCPEEVRRYLGETIGFWIQTVALIASAVGAFLLIRDTRKGIERQIAANHDAIDNQIKANQLAVDAQIKANQLTSDGQIKANAAALEAQIRTSQEGVEKQGQGRQQGTGAACHDRADAKPELRPAA